MKPAIDMFPGVETGLRRHYAEPTRHYHGQAHIDACLAHFASVRDRFADPVAAELALWFHDAIYDAKAADNEERSADLASATLSAHGASTEQVHAVRRLILVTKHDATPVEVDAQLVVDIDLAILGADATAFDAYERAIRLEYAHVPDEAFRAGRAAVLKRFLARERIFATDLFCSRFEAPARSNLARSLAALG